MQFKTPHTLASGVFVVAVLTLIFTVLPWVETSHWLQQWMSAMTLHGALVQLSLLSVLGVIVTWAILKLQSRLTKQESRLMKLESRLMDLETRVESHDHDDAYGFSKRMVKSEE